LICATVKVGHVMVRGNLTSSRFFPDCRKRRGD
jgi:hypothetical protein